MRLISNVLDTQISTHTTQFQAAVKQPIQVVSLVKTTIKFLTGVKQAIQVVSLAMATVKFQCETSYPSGQSCKGNNKVSSALGGKVRAGAELKELSKHILMLNFMF